MEQAINWSFFRRNSETAGKKIYQNSKMIFLLVNLFTIGLLKLNLTNNILYILFLVCIPLFTFYILKDTFVEYIKGTLEMRKKAYFKKKSKLIKNKLNFLKTKISKIGKKAGRTPIKIEIKEIEEIQKKYA